MNRIKAIRRQTVTLKSCLGTLRTQASKRYNRMAPVMSFPLSTKFISPRFRVEGNVKCRKWSIYREIKSRLIKMTTGLWDKASIVRASRAYQTAVQTTILQGMTTRASQALLGYKQTTWFHYQINRSPCCRWMESPRRYKRELKTQAHRPRAL